MTRGFDLSDPSLPAHLLHRIVQKFDYKTGIKFYRSCKDVKEYVDDLKPSWPLEDAQLYFTFNHQRFHWKVGHNLKLSDVENEETLKFVKLSSILIQGCDDRYLKEVAIPEIKKLKAGSRLFLRKTSRVNFSDDSIGQIIRAVRPNCLCLQDQEFDYHNPHFKNIPHLDLLAYPLKNYENVLFEVGLRRKFVSFGFVRDFTSFLAKLIETWKEGKSTGSLEILTIYGYKGLQNLNALFRKLECQKTKSGHFTLKREEVAGERNELLIREVAEISRTNIQIKFI